MLRLLAARPGAAVDRAALAWAVTGRPPAKGSRSLDVHVSALRATLAGGRAAGRRPAHHGRARAGATCWGEGRRPPRYRAAFASRSRTFGRIFSS